MATTRSAEINAYWQQLQSYDIEIANPGLNDAALDAKIPTTLENPSQVVNFTYPWPRRRGQGARPDAACGGRIRTIS